MSKTTDPAELLSRATGEPVAVLSEGELMLSELTDPDQRAVVYRAMALAARNASTTEMSIEYARLGSEEAADDTLRRECLLTLAGSVADAGQVSSALEILDRASQGASGLVAGQLEFQRGAILGPTAEYEAALESFRRAMSVFKAHGRKDFMAMTLHNLGFIYTQTGRLADAESALLDARVIEEALGRHMEVSGTDNNLGILASYRGDIPEALRRLAMSDETEMTYGATAVPTHVTRCEVLISAGLFHEALDLAKQIAAGAKKSGRAGDEAEAVAVAARAALLADELGQAVDLAAAARRKFEAQSRGSWASQVDLILIEAEYRASGPTIALRDRARAVARSLESAGLQFPAARARLLAGRLSILLDDVDAAREDFSRLGEGRSGPVELRVQRWHAKAMLREAERDLRGAAAAVRAGLDLLDDYQSGLGATDLRAGIERQGGELGMIGLRLATGSGEPRRVLRWMERTRARALRYPPVVPDVDDPEQPLLAELRRVTAQLRAGGDEPDRELARRRRQLQEEIRARNRVRRMEISQEGRARPEDIAAGLDGTILLEIGRVDSRLVAVTVHDGKFRLHEIGESAEVESQLRRLRFEMRRAARLGRDAAAVRADIARFDQALLGRIGPFSGRVVVVPDGPLMAVPWLVLPSLSDATVTVAPSAELWLRGRQREPTGHGVVLAAGPDLDYASEEVSSLHRLYPDATLIDETASAEEFGAAVRGSAIAHTVCHASFNVENPMFSSLRLGDGEFNVYDIERLGNPPDLMVFSACDSGYTDTRAGDEVAGLTSALLGMGARSVVASIGLVPDSVATAHLMNRFHEHLQSGHGASEALSLAGRESADNSGDYLAAASFICVGG